MQSFEQTDDSVTHKVLIGLAKISLALRSHAWQQAGQRGLTPTQAQILALLRSEQGLRLSGIADRLAVTPATVSEAVATLMRKGLVQKAPSSEDARVMIATLTPAGQQEAERIARWPDFLMDVVHLLSDAEQEILLLALIKIIRMLQERGQIPVSRMCVTCRFFRPHVHADPERPHHCMFVNAPFGSCHLRLECPDHEVAAPDEQQRTWEQFTATVRHSEAAGGPR
jgi:DNA-binding MarR family transcriptional regulator